MTPEQEKKWREEFRTLKNKQVAKYVSDHALDTIYMDDLEIYLAARKAAQVEIDSLLNQISDYTRRNEDDLENRDQEIERLKLDVKHGCSICATQPEVTITSLEEQLKERDELIKEAIEFATGSRSQWIEKARKVVGG